MQERKVHNHVGAAEEHAVIETEKYSKRLNTLTASIATLKSVVQSQIEILEDLRDTYENPIKIPAKDGSYKRAAANMPVINRLHEQIPLALEAIDKVIEERQKYEQKLDILLGKVERLRKHVFPLPVLITQLIQGTKKMDS